MTILAPEAGYAVVPHPSGAAIMTRPAAPDILARWLAPFEALFSPGRLGGTSWS
jgi:hypothetical protein